MKMDENADDDETLLWNLSFMTGLSGIAACSQPFYEEI